MKATERKRTKSLAKEDLIRGRILLAMATIQGQDSNNIYAAVDSAASGGYPPMTYVGEHHDETAPKHLVGTANNGGMTSAADDRFILPGLTAATRECQKSWGVTLPLVPVGGLWWQRLGGIVGGHGPPNVAWQQASKGARCKGVPVPG